MSSRRLWPARPHAFIRSRRRRNHRRYKVIISLIDKKMVSDFARKHGITLVERTKSPLAGLRT